MKVRLSVAMLLGCASVLAGPPGELTAQACDSLLLRHAAGTLPYTHRGDRCEGFYRGQVSAPYMQLVGVMRGRLHFADTVTEHVRLAPAEPVEQKLSVLVRPFPVKSYYQMASLLEPGKELDWPVEVPVRGGLTARQLSVAAWFVTSRSRVYVPLRATPLIAKPLSDSVVRVMLRSNVTLEYLQHTWVSESGRYEGTPSPRPVVAGEPILVPLPDTLSGPVVVDVTGRIRERRNEDEWVSIRVTVWMGNP